ncbi:MAG: SH3 domain-containing protein [Chloroflexota bacterium]
MLRSRLAIILSLMVLILAACNFPGTSPEDMGRLYTAAAQTIVAEATLTAAGQSQVPAGSVEATLTLTTSPGAPIVEVSVDTNCRTGPGEPYDIVGYLLVGESAEVVGRGEWGQFWVVENPDGSGLCWLWAQYAAVEGDTSALPVMTPPPTPTLAAAEPLVLSYVAEYQGYFACGDDFHMSFLIGNDGQVELDFVEIGVHDLTSEVVLFEGVCHIPFVSGPEGCEPDLESLGPGGVAFISVPVGSTDFLPPEFWHHDVGARIRICSPDGRCLEKLLYFVPE